MCRKLRLHCKLRGPLQRRASSPKNARTSSASTAPIASRSLTCARATSPLQVTVTREVVAASAGRNSDADDMTGVVRYRTPHVTQVGRVPVREGLPAGVHAVEAATRIVGNEPRHRPLHR